MTVKRSGMTISEGIRRLCAALALLGAGTALAGAQEFPFDQEMLLEVKPLPGSRRVPMIEIRADGRATVDLWCHTAAADVTISGDQIKLTFVSARPESCTSERIALDQQMGAALAEITGWRRENDIVVLTGPTTFRFRLSTH
ncbi:MAG: META domain-containing protein [Xanthobacteraceae bacterium]